jgi:hypothetical protein
VLLLDILILTSFIHVFEIPSWLRAYAIVHGSQPILNLQSHGEALSSLETVVAHHCCDGVDLQTVYRPFGFFAVLAVMAIGSHSAILSFLQVNHYFGLFVAYHEASLYVWALLLAFCFRRALGCYMASFNSF